MFKFIAFFALVAVTYAAPKPGVVSAYSAPVVSAYSAPAVVSAYSAPVLAPASTYTAKYTGLPVAYSAGYHTGVHGYSAYGAHPAAYSAYGAHPAAYSAYGAHPAAYSAFGAPYVF